MAVLAVVAAVFAAILSLVLFLILAYSLYLVYIHRQYAHIPSPKGAS